MPRRHDGGALQDRRTNKNAAGLEVLAALNSNLAAIRSLLSDYRVNLQSRGENTGSGRTCQGILGMDTVMGAQPFFGPSQPGMGMEERPAAPPPTTQRTPAPARNVGASPA